MADRRHMPEDKDMNSEDTNARKHSSDVDEEV